MSWAKIVHTDGQRLLADVLKKELKKQTGRRSRSELALEVGASLPSLIAWAAGARRPMFLMRKRLLRAFGIPIRSWLTEEEREQFEAA